MLEGVWMPQLLGTLIKSAEEFYKDPENEKAFQEWKEKRSGKNERAV